MLNLSAVSTDVPRQVLLPQHQSLSKESEQLEADRVNLHGDIRSSPIPQSRSDAIQTETKNPDVSMDIADPSLSGVQTDLEGEEDDNQGENQGQGAYNSETGEINWDCPCLGGMAHGPCGTEFRAAFSCFVHSKEEPKGMECIEHFKYVGILELHVDLG